PDQIVERDEVEIELEVGRLIVQSVDIERERRGDAQRDRIGRVLASELAPVDVPPDLQKRKLLVRTNQERRAHGSIRHYDVPPPLEELIEQARGHGGDLGANSGVVDQVVSRA